MPVVSTIIQDRITMKSGNRIQADVVLSKEVEQFLRADDMMLYLLAQENH